MRLDFAVTHQGGNTYSFGARLQDDFGQPVAGAIVQYESRRAAPGQKLPAEFGYTGADYTDASGSVSMTNITFADVLTGYTDQWRVHAVDYGLTSTVWQFTIGEPPVQVAEANLTLAALPLALALVFSVDWVKLAKRGLKH